MKVTGGSLSVKADGEDDYLVAATGESGGGEKTNISAGVGVLISDANRKAEIGENAEITAGSLEVSSVTSGDEKGDYDEKADYEKDGKKEGQKADPSNDATVTAVSGVGGGGDASFSGGVAVNLADYKAAALIGDGVKLSGADAGGVSVKADNITNFTTDASGTVGAADGLVEFAEIPALNADR